MDSFEEGHFHFKTNQVGFEGNARAYLGPDAGNLASAWWGGESMHKCGIFSVKNQNQYRSFSYAKKGNEWVKTTSTKLGLPPETLNSYFYTFPPQSKLTESQQAHLDKLCLPNDARDASVREKWRENEAYVASLKMCANSIPDGPRFKGVTDLEAAGFRGQLDVSTKHVLHRVHNGLQWIGSVGEGASSFINRTTALCKLFSSCAADTELYPQYRRIGTPWQALETVLQQQAGYSAKTATQITDVLKKVLDDKIKGEGLGKPKAKKKPVGQEASSGSESCVEVPKNILDYEEEKREDPRFSVDAYIRMRMQTPMCQLESIYVCSTLLARIPMGRHVLLLLSPALSRKSSAKTAFTLAYNKLLYQLYSAVETCVDSTVREKVESYDFFFLGIILIKLNFFPFLFLCYNVLIIS